MTIIVEVVWDFIRIEIFTKLDFLDGLNCEIDGSFFVGFLVSFLYYLYFWFLLFTPSVHWVYLFLLGADLFICCPFAYQKKKIENQGHETIT